MRAGKIKICKKQSISKEKCFFNSAKLREAIISTKPQTAVCEQTLNHMLHYIRNLEIYLQGLGISLCIHHSFRYHRLDQSIHEEGVGRVVTGVVKRQFISWDESRLVYSEDEYQIVDGAKSCVVVKLRTPLMECTAAIRSQVYPHLPELIKRLGEELPTPKRARE